MNLPTASVIVLKEEGLATYQTVRNATKIRTGPKTYMNRLAVRVPVRTAPLPNPLRLRPKALWVNARPKHKRDSPSGFSKTKTRIALDRLRGARILLPKQIIPSGRVSRSQICRQMEELWIPKASAK